MVDLNFYSYQNERFGAVALTFLDDMETSLGMTYEIYPVFMYLAITVFFAGSYAILRSFGSTYGLISDEFYYIINDRTGKDELFRYRSDTPGLNVSAQYPEQYQRMSELAKGLKQSSYYLLQNNKEATD
ncbi:MAG: hypothetical protein OEX12_01385 [Gammaproteobacteria bacterium]|nr:hypothetical protein [Gammaproteobacteria bacterium]